jgi:hypothetical protein
MNAAFRLVSERRIHAAAKNLVVRPDVCGSVRPLPMGGGGHLKARECARNLIASARDVAYLHSPSRAKKERLWKNVLN